MDFRYQAAIARALGQFVEQGLVYKGKKPVHWCIHCRTALAEAEVEYADHTSPSIYVEFPLVDGERRGAGRARAGARADATCRSSSGRRRRGRFRRTWRSRSIRSSSMRAYAVDGRVGHRRRGARREGRGGRRTHVWCARRPDEGRAAGADPVPASALRSRSLGVLADYVTLEAGHRRRAHRARSRRGRLHTGVGTVSRSTRPSARAATSSIRWSSSAGSACSTRTRRSRRRSKERGRLWHRETFEHHIRTAGAATIR